MSIKILTILGPTSTGKTDLALNLAKKFNGELIACDSRQVYKKLDIGTGKIPTKTMEIVKNDGWWEIKGIKVWMYDVVDLKKQYTVANYAKEAMEIIQKINKKEKLPIVVGGTGLYMRSLLEGLPNLTIPFDENIRTELLELTIEGLQERLRFLSDNKWKSLNQSDKHNPHRLIRAIELIMMNPYRRKIKSQNVKIKNLDTLKIGLTAPKEVLYKRINAKVLEWIDLGIVQEVKELLKKGVNRNRIERLGLEYKIVIEYLDSTISLNQMIEKMQNKTRQYAKRQMTWFKKEKNVVWFDITSKNYLKELEKVVFKWYYSKDAKKN